MYTLRLLDTVKQQSDEVSKDENVSANKDWFMDFKGSYDLCNSVQEIATSTDDGSCRKHGSFLIGN